MDEFGKFRSRESLKCKSDFEVALERNEWSIIEGSESLGRRARNVEQMKVWIEVTKEEKPFAPENGSKRVDRYRLPTKCTS